MPNRLDSSLFQKIDGKIFFGIVSSHGSVVKRSD